MTTELRTSLIEYLQTGLDEKKKELVLVKSFPDQLTALGHIKLVISAQEFAKNLEATITRVEKQISLLKSSEVEKMNDEEFKLYINQ